MKRKGSKTTGAAGGAAGNLFQPFSFDRQA